MQAQLILVILTSEWYQGMIYCLAVDMFEKAVETDSSLINEATKLIDVYSNYFPSREGVPFFGPNEGQKYKIECWINKEFKVRYR